MKSYVFFQIINFAAFIEDYAECSPLLMEKCCPYLIAMFDIYLHQRSLRDLVQEIAITSRIF